jgi:hexosaminidase
LSGFNDTWGVPRRMLGAEVAAWSEHIVPPILDYVLWPRAAALAERLWSSEQDTEVGRSTQIAGTAGA